MGIPNKVSAKRTLRSAAERVTRWPRQAYRRNLVRRFPARTFKFAPPRATQPSPYGFPVAKDNVLEELGEAHRPSKRNHNYLPYYWMHLRDIREQVTNVLEIGVQTDCSMKMWEDFFPIATIHGLDIDPKCKALEGGRRRVHIR